MATLRDMSDPMKGARRKAAKRTPSSGPRTGCPLVEGWQAVGEQDAFQRPCQATRKYVDCAQ